MWPTFTAFQKFYGNHITPEYFLIIFYLFISERHTDTHRGRDIGRGRSRLYAGSIMLNSIPGLGSHILHRRQMLNYRPTQVSLHQSIF